MAVDEERRATRPDQGGSAGPEDVQAFLLASRALVAIAARSVDDAQSDLTLPQYRALVVLGTRGVLNVTVLADEVGVHQTTASRLVARLVHLGLVERHTNEHNRREVQLDLTAAGRALLDRVLSRREADIAAILGRMRPSDRMVAVDALLAFAAAAGEPPETCWSWGITPGTASTAEKETTPAGRATV